MSDERLKPLDEDLSALLDAERSAFPPSGALGRVWDRVAVVGSARPSTTPGGSWLAANALPVALSAFVLGGVAGAGLHAKLAAVPAERVVRVYVPAPSAPQAIESPVSSPVPPPVVSTSEAARPAPHPNAPPAPSGPSTLSAERLLLDQTRDALTTGDPDRALSLLSDHAHRFPKPQLGEERDALAIQALAAAGRYGEARERAAHFRASQPNSLFLPAVEATIASIP